ncbi:hypothetical protein GCM10007939_11910 [Amylibacter marinus]|uniref:Tyrosine specific protein phosphatases domain-containing protein n=1 Tax=Amylibacter marinus TaxID=1475483 RepID=A0ABQ5VUK3_9RHOB|nr:protein-tyrosine phosphatase family protein [Amylibacter marinus]GLQ34908.1 hypothetical protein GCM10007939_11910 [Amylibacter marinus]
MSEAFDIYDLSPMIAGDIGICPLPRAPADFAAISRWQADIAVTLTTEVEYPFADFPDHLAAVSGHWLPCPIPDFGTPEQDVSDLVSRLDHALRAGQRVLIHCLGGRGRSGMLALRLLVTQGQEPQSALADVRRARAHAVETDAQYLWATSAQN